jgi:hypothetical protein
MLLSTASAWRQCHGAFACIPAGGTKRISQCTEQLGGCRLLMAGLVRPRHAAIVAGIVHVFPPFRTGMCSMERLRMRAGCTLPDRNGKLGVLNLFDHLEPQVHRADADDIAGSEPALIHALTVEPDTVAGAAAHVDQHAAAAVGALDHCMIAMHRAIIQANVVLFAASNPHH